MNINTDTQLHIMVYKREREGLITDIAIFRNLLTLFQPSLVELLHTVGPF